MTDTLLVRAQLAIEESCKLQHRCRTVKAELERERERLRLALFESAMARSESRANRDNRKRE